MEKVVKTGLKFDLHIHSVVSAHKDGIKVKNNTLENIGVLIERLNDNKVNLCSITDHDNFSYEMYRGLKAAESMDNSILRVLPGVEFSQSLSVKVKDGYKRYLKDNGISIKKQLQPEDIFCFDMQGEVRSKFEENKLNASEFLKEYFPSDVNPLPYRSVLNAETERMCQYLSRKFEMDKRLEELLSFPIVIDDSTAESMTFVNNARSAKQTSEKETEISGKLEAIIVAVNEISQLVTIKDDQDELAVILKGLQNMKRRYDYQVDTVDKENTRIETVHKILTSISTRHLKTISDRQKKQ